MATFEGKTSHPDITIDDLEAARNRSHREYDELVERIRRRERRGSLVEDVAILAAVAVAGYLLGVAGCAMRAPVHAVQPTPTSWQPPPDLKGRCQVAESVTFPKNIDDPAVAGRTVVVLECNDGQRMVDRTTKETRLFIPYGAAK